MNLLIDPVVSDQAMVKATSAADVVLLTDNHEKDALKGSMVLDGPGEYEVKGAMITGTPAQRHIDAEGELGTIYTILIDGYTLAYLGNVSPTLSDRQLEHIGQVDVLILPVGGHGLTLDAHAASEIASEIEPKYVIPVHYEDGKSKYSMPQDPVSLFLKEMGAEVRPVSKLRLTSKDMPEETTVVLLERS
jgi:L-ascorbate metabolism protein UlaG (beta-lactamase superfamily)